MSKIKAIEKLRESSHLDDEKWTLSDGRVMWVTNGEPNDINAVNWGEQWRKLADEIEAEIAERYQLLPVDADGVPIHVGDTVQFVNDTGGMGAKVEVCAVSNYYAYYGEGKHFYRAKNCRHVKPRTVEDVLCDLFERKMSVTDAEREIHDMLGSDA